MLPGLHGSGVSGTGRFESLGGQQLFEFVGRECGVEVIEVEGWPGPTVTHQESVFKLAMQRGGERSASNSPPYPASQESRRQPAIRAVHLRVENRPGIAGIACQSFIAPLARENKNDALAGKARDIEKRNAGGPDNRLVLVPDQARQAVKEFFAAETHFVVVRLDVGGNLSRIGQFTEFFFAISHGEGLNLVATNFGREGGNGAGV